MIDPALEELLDGDAAEEIPVIVRLTPGGEPPPGVRVVARFDTVATCRVRRGDLLRVRAADTIESVKAVRLVAAEPDPDPRDPDLPDPDAPPGPAAGDRRRPDDLPATGRGTVVAAVDWGCDFAHPDFRNPDGTTRLLAIWDQRPAPGARPPDPYGYGRVHTRAAIDRALRSPDPYAALGYHPASGAADRSGTHGTHVLSIAAGNGAGGGPEGVAPEADLLFVHLTSGRTGGLANLGDSVTILEALDFASKVAGDRPLVVNASVGRHGGPHDGSTLVEQGLDEFVGRPGRCVVQSCGNYYDRAIHTSGRLLPGETHTLRWTVDGADVTPNEMEVWYPGHDTLTFTVGLPGVVEPVRLRLGEAAPLLANGREVGRAYHRNDDPNNGNHHVDVFLDAGGPSGTWEVRVTGTDVADGRYHAWVERDAACPGCQSSFDPGSSDPSATTGTICHGLRTIAVGAYDAHDPDRSLAPFSSSGPTLDGRQKPEILAPGVRVLAARSAPPGGRPGARYVRKSGTSMAAPHVAGTVACMYEAAGRPVPIAEVRAALARTAARPVPLGAADRGGAGYLDVAAAVDAVAGGSAQHEGEEAEQMICTPAPEPDPTGRAPHPTVRRPNKRPVVGYAQQCLGRWMTTHATTPHPCGNRAAVDADLARLRGFGQFPLVVDCDFGSKTELATKAFQRCQSVNPDGVIGRITWPLLKAFDPAGTGPGPVPPVPPVRDEAMERWRELLGPDARDGNDVLELIDGAATFASMRDAILTATGREHFVYQLGWWLDLDVSMTPAPCPPAPGPDTIRSLYTDAAARNVQIRAMLWDQTGNRKNQAEAAFIDGLPTGGAFTDNVQHAPTVAAHHQKLLVVYGEQGLVAFCGGIDVNCDRVCPQGTCPAGGSGSASSNAAGQPLHDVHCRITGPAAWDLLRVFVKRWHSNPAHAARDAREALRGLLVPRPGRTGPAVVRVGETYNATATMPGSTTPTVFRDRTVREIMLTAIRSARRFLYFEEQYLVSMEAADAIRRALPNLDHVTILIPGSEITALPQVWCRRRAFIDHIRTSPHGAKLRVYELCDPSQEGMARFVPHTYVHAKMLVADDELAVIGSANVNRRGWESDSEVTAAIAGPGRDGAPLARTLRERLWAEHLGVPRSAVTDPIASKGLWDTSPTRRVCPYDPRRDTDALGCSDFFWDRIIDPPFPTTGPLVAPAPLPVRQRVPVGVS